jgi:2-hydroxychromene-2-carboxylate isomerase
MQIEFFWDPGSTNTYFAWHLLKPIAQRYNAEVVLQPFNLGYVFRHHNYVLMEEPSAKIRNRKRDLDRWAEKYKLPFRMPGEFPIKTSRILRGALAVRKWGLETEFIDEVFKSYWERGDASVATDEGLEKVASTLEIDPEEFLALLSSDEIGEALRQKTREALDRGVFGAPAFIIEDELYWGKDRMEFVEDHLSRLAGQSL